MEDIPYHYNISIAFEKSKDDTIMIINCHTVPYGTMSYLILAATQSGRFLFRGIPLIMTFAKNRQKPQVNVFISF